MRKTTVGFAALAAALMAAGCGKGAPAETPKEAPTATSDAKTEPAAGAKGEVTLTADAIRLARQSSL